MEILTSPAPRELDETMGPVHYRVVNYWDGDGTSIRVERWEVVKETPAGYWVQDEYTPRFYGFEEKRKFRLLKWVHKVSGKRYCYPSLSEALASFKKRKERQVSRLRHDLKQAEAALAGVPLCMEADPKKFIQEGVYLGQVPSLLGLSLKGAY